MRRLVPAESRACLTRCGRATKPAHPRRQKATTTTICACLSAPLPRRRPRYHGRRMIHPAASHRFRRAAGWEGEGRGFLTQDYGGRRGSLVQQPCDLCARVVVYFYFFLLGQRAQLGRPPRVVALATLGRRRERAPSPEAAVVCCCCGCPSEAQSGWALVVVDAVERFDDQASGSSRRESHPMGIDHPRGWTVGSDYCMVPHPPAYDLLGRYGRYSRDGRDGR